MEIKDLYKNYPFDYAVKSGKIENGKVFLLYGFISDE